MNANDLLLKRTYHHSSFKDVNYLVTQKIRHNVKISVCLPTLNVASTIGKNLEIIREKLMDDYPLVDQLAIIDSRSRDGTPELARAAGAEVYFDDELLPEQGIYKGKGEALWKSMAALTGDIIVWVDSDIKNFDARFITGVVGPLLIDPKVQFSKAFYERSVFVDGTELKRQGGRVTELTARPYLNLFFPELAQIVQPLSGEMAIRRDAARSIPFYTGYAVDIAMVIYIYKKFGLEGMAQVNLDSRVHHNQSLFDLSRMSFAIMQALLTISEELGQLELKTAMSKEFRQVSEKRIHEDINSYFKTQEVAVHKRPPIDTVLLP